MSSDIPRPASTQSFASFLTGVSRLTWAIIGGGFALGVLCGTFFILGASQRSTDIPPVSSKASDAAQIAPTSTASSLPAEESPATRQLAAERQRLRQELDAARLRREVNALRRELTELQSSPVSVETDVPQTSHRGEIPFHSRMTHSSAPVARPAVEPAPVAQGQATLDYWNQMNAIILQEAALRAAPSGGISAANAAGFLDARIQAAEFAVDSFRQLDVSGVDSRVVALGEQLIAWYDDGRSVAATGKQLLTGASVQQRQGSAGKQYQAAERRHAEDVAAINAEGAHVRQAMSRQYRLNFPPLN